MSAPQCWDIRVLPSVMVVSAPQCCVVGVLPGPILVCTVHSMHCDSMNGPWHCNVYLPALRCVLGVLLVAGHTAGVLTK